MSGRPIPVRLAGGALLAVLACGGGDRPAEGEAPADTADRASDEVADTQLVVDSIGREFLVITTGRSRIREVRPRAGAGDPDAPGAVETIGPEAARSRMESAPVPWYVIDVRTSREYAAGHLPGTLLVPVDQLEANVEDLHVRVDQVVLVYDGGGDDGRAREAARLLASYGFQIVRLLEGGLAAWREAGLEVEGAR